MRRFILLAIFFLGTFSFSFAALPTTEKDQVEFPYEKVADGEDLPNQVVVDMSWYIRDGVIGDTTKSSDDGIIQRLIKAIRGAGFIDENSSAGGHNYIINIINLWLQLAAVIALFFLIYGFLSMFFAKTDEAFTTAKKIIINTAIAIVILWLSWFIVSVLFYLQGKTEDVELWPNTSDVAN